MPCRSRGHIPQGRIPKNASPPPMDGRKSCGVRRENSSPQFGAPGAVGGHDGRGCSDGRNADQARAWRLGHRRDRGALRAWLRVEPLVSGRPGRRSLWDSYNVGSDSLSKTYAASGSVMSGAQAGKRFLGPLIRINRRPRAASTADGAFSASQGAFHVGRDHAGHRARLLRVVGRLHHRLRRL